MLRRFLRSNHPYSTVKNFIRISIFIILLCAICLPVSSDIVAGAGIKAQAGINASTASQDKLLQFTSGGHALGFGKDVVYLAGLDHSLQVEFIGGRAVQPAAEGAGTVQNGAAPLGNVTYQDIWKNIDVSYHTVEGGIAESTYVIHPGGNPSDISLRYNTPVEIEQGGGLSFSFENGYVTESAPVAWQEKAGERIPVAAQFIKQGEKEVGLALAAYDSNYAVYIDPTYQWHTFYGSTNSDQANAIAVDSAGNVYLAGISSGSWNGPAGQLPLNAYNSLYDITIVKLNSAGAYQWHTFYGSTHNNNEYAYAIALDSASNVYVAGESKYTFTGPAGQPPLNPHDPNGANVDMVIIKLNSAGAYQWHTFLGSASTDQPFAIALDSANNIYVAGRSGATWGTNVKNPYSGGTQYNIVVVKLNSLGAYVWNTFYGSTGVIVQAYAMALDSAGNIYVAGSSAATWGAPLHAFSGGAYDIVVVKLDSAGAYQWHTFYGPIVPDFGNSIAVDPANNIYVMGTSNITWNGPAGQTPLNAHTAGSNYDFAILKLNSAGAYQWHTFYGSTTGDYATAMALDPAGNVYVAGFSDATWNGPAGQLPLNAHAAGSNDDIAILKLNSAGTYQWHTFYGSTSDDSPFAMAVDPASNIYVAGRSIATWGAPLNPHTAGNNNDFVVIKLNDAAAGQSTASVGTSLGTVNFATNAGYISGLTNLPPSSMPCSSGGYIFPFGMFSYSISNLAPGATAMVTITTPVAVPMGSKVFKCQNGNLVDFTQYVQQPDANTFILTLKDGGPGDADGVANGTIVDPCGPAFTDTSNHHRGSTLQPMAPQGPAPMANIAVQSASLSTAKVAPGAPITVTANVANKGTANGSTQVKLYVNGQEEAHQGVTLSGGGNTPIKFTVSRDEPGSYSVYVGSLPAGTFEVDRLADPNLILYISGALLLFALAGGVIFMMMRRPR
ncbi:MAG: SBBP repeat-containing protein [Dehalococcoidia bacterium]